VASHRGPRCPTTAAPLPLCPAYATAAAPLLLRTLLGCMRVRLSALPRCLPPHAALGDAAAAKSTHDAYVPRPQRSCRTDRWLHAHATRLHRCTRTSWRGSSAPFRLRRSRPTCGGDPSADSVHFPSLSSVHHGQWGRSLCVGRRDHHRPIHHALSFVVLWPCRSTPPHHERCPTVLQFWSCPSASQLRPSSVMTHGYPLAVHLEPNRAHRQLRLHLSFALRPCPEPLPPPSSR
jgi:hypothetical protein